MSLPPLDWTNHDLRMKLSFVQRATSAVNLAERTFPPSALRRIVDVGCGAQYLRTLLPQDSHYIPLDVAALTPDCLVVDLNHQPFPCIHADTAFMLGVAEYLTDLSSVLESISENCDYLVLTYDVRPEVRRRVNNYDTKTILRLLEATGWKVLNRHNFWYLATASQ